MRRKSVRALENPSLRSLRYGDADGNVVNCMRCRIDVASRVCEFNRGSETQQGSFDCLKESRKSVARRNPDSYTGNEVLSNSPERIRTRIRGRGRNKSFSHHEAYFSDMGSCIS